MKKTVVLFLLLSVLYAPNGKAQKEVIPSPTAVSSADNQSKGLKRKVAIARFSNESKYAKGLFYDKKNDPLEKQAIDILSSKLASSGKFMLIERADMAKVLGESNNLSDSLRNQIGADFLIIGSITEYGRKNIGNDGVFSASKQQIVQVGVNLRLIDVSTGLIIYSEEARGEASTKTKTTMGVGSKADYDAALDDQAISAAISQLVENVINNCMDKPWKAYFLTKDKDGTIISGGKSQGITKGNIFIVKQKGRKVKNPQTGISIEIPGKMVGKVRVLEVGGETPMTEYSFVEFTEGNIDSNNIGNYYIQEDIK
jgi:curli biogenesis system outer membrane secretion channel CsgG